MFTLGSVFWRHQKKIGVLREGSETCTQRVHLASMMSLMIEKVRPTNLQAGCVAVTVPALFDHVKSAANQASSTLAVHVWISKSNTTLDPLSASQSC